MAYAKLTRLGEPGAEVGRSFERMAELLAGSPETGIVQFQILSGDRRLSWCLEMTGKECRVSTEPVAGPDLDVLVREETWRHIAEGGLSPIEAFGRGKMRIRGNIELATRIYERLGSPEGGRFAC